MILGRPLAHGLQLHSVLFVSQDRLCEAARHPPPDLAIEAIKQELERRFERDVPAGEIGKLVMEQLKQLDPVAYIRFASVYQNFSNPDEFIAEIQSLRARP